MADREMDPSSFRGNRSREDYNDERSRRGRNNERRRRRSRSRDSYEERSNDDKDYRRRSRSRSRSRSPSRRHRDRSWSRRSRDRGRNRDRSRSRSRSRERDRGDRDHANDRLKREEHDAERIKGRDWRFKLTSIRDAHFNRSKQTPTVIAQNQFRNDGSFLEMFKQKMADQTSEGTEKQQLAPNSLVLASSSIQYSPGLSLPPLTTSTLDQTQASSSSSVDQDLDGVPIRKPLPVPVSVGKRRSAKPLKTGVVFKKPKDNTEEEGSQEKLDAWSRYLQEVQKYKTANCVEDDVSRPLVK